MRKLYFFTAICLFSLLGACGKDETQPGPDGPDGPDIPVSEWRLASYDDPEGYPGVPRSTIYSVTLIQGDERVTIPVFQSSCPVYQAGYMDMTPTGSASSRTGASVGRIFRSTGRLRSRSGSSIASGFPSSAGSRFCLPVTASRRRSKAMWCASRSRNPDSARWRSASTAIKTD